MTISIIEPKYVDSYRTRSFQPDSVTGISNLWIAGAHCKNKTELWSIEAASEVGRSTADAITGSNTVITQNRGVVLKFMELMDDVFFNVGLPNIADVVIGILAFLILAFLIFFVIILLATTNVVYTIIIIFIVLILAYILIRRII